MAEVIKTTGERIIVAPKSGKKKFTLEELQGYVGGYIEAVYLPKRRVMVVNEEGKLRGLPFNQIATAMVMEAGQIVGPIVGDVIICGPGEM
jgi:hypothetical protein